MQNENGRRVSLPTRFWTVKSVPRVRRNDCFKPHSDRSVAIPCRRAFRPIATLPVGRRAFRWQWDSGRICIQEGITMMQTVGTRGVA